MVINLKDDGDVYIFNGVKMWIINLFLVDIVVVWVKDEEGIICGVIVEKDMFGFSVFEIYGKWLLCVSIIGELVFEDVCVFKVNVLFNVQGFKGLLFCLSKVCYGIVWGVVGVVLDCYDFVLCYSLEWEQFGKLIVGFQLI